MKTWKVVIVALGDHASVAESIRSRLASAWGQDVGSARLEPLVLSGDELTAIAQADAVILIGDAAASQSSSLAIFDAIAEANVPALALVNGVPPKGAESVYSWAGAAVEPADVSDQRLCGVLHGLLHRQQEVVRLNSEASLAQRFQGGLKGQIAKMHEELQLAAMVQREFLPREVPALHNVEFAALWRPTNYVSGDIYDLIRLDDDHVGVFLADAVGHGVPAALMTMVICRSLTTRETIGKSLRILSAAEVMTRLNAEMIRRQGQTTRFATAVYAVINCRRRTVQLAGAGHPPPLRFSIDGACESLETHGGLLGVFEDEIYDQIEFDLHFGDRLLFYTDGFEQAFPAAAPDGHHSRIPTMQYRTEFNHLCSLASAAEMIDVIGQRLDDQAGSLHQVDDLTLVCVHAGPLTSARTPGARLESIAR